MLQKIKNIYFYNNPILKKFSNPEFLINIGYPKNFLKKLPKNIIDNSFPVVFPFNDINLKNKKLLDLGCGIGLDSAYAIHMKAKFVVGIDISFSILKNGVNFPKINANIEQIPIKKRQFFDIILFNGSFNQIIKKYSLLNLIFNFLNINGIVIICDLFWIGQKEELEIYRNNEDAWLFNVGGCLTEQSILNIEAETQFKILIFEKLEKENPVQKYRLILKK